MLRKSDAFVEGGGGEELQHNLSKRISLSTSLSGDSRESKGLDWRDREI